MANFSATTIHVHMFGIYVSTHKERWIVHLWRYNLYLVLVILSTALKCLMVPKQQSLTSGFATRFIGQVQTEIIQHLTHCIGPCVQTRWANSSYRSFCEEHQTIMFNHALVLCLSLLIARWFSSGSVVSCRLKEISWRSFHSRGLACGAGVGNRQTSTSIVLGSGTGLPAGGTHQSVIGGGNQFGIFAHFYATTNLQL